MDHILITTCLQSRHRLMTLRKDTYCAVICVWWPWHHFLMIRVIRYGHNREKSNTAPIRWSRTLKWAMALVRTLAIITLRPAQNGRHFAGDIFGVIFINENCRFFIKISLKFVPCGQFSNKPPLVQIMIWCQIGDKPLSELMMTLFTGDYMRPSASVSYAEPRAA